MTDRLPAFEHLSRSESGLGHALSPEVPRRIPADVLIAGYGAGPGRVCCVDHDRSEHTFGQSGKIGHRVGAGITHRDAGFEQGDDGAGGPGPDRHLTDTGADAGAVAVVSVEPRTDDGRVAGAAGVGSGPS